eukprot:scaffold32696_cov101-Isochrysis_galbana.AAC.1
MCRCAALSHGRTAPLSDLPQRDRVRVGGGAAAEEGDGRDAVGLPVETVSDRLPWRTQRPHVSVVRHIGSA